MGRGEGEGEEEEEEEGDGGGSVRAREGWDDIQLSIETSIIGSISVVHQERCATECLNSVTHQERCAT
jgi:hypothetical protein